MESVEFALSVLYLLSRGVEQWPDAEARATLTAGIKALGVRLEEGPVCAGLVPILQQLQAAGRALLGEEGYGEAARVCARMNFNFSAALKYYRELESVCARIADARDDTTRVVPQERLELCQSLIDTCDQIDDALVGNPVLWAVLDDIQGWRDRAVGLLGEWVVSVRVFVFGAEVDERVAKVPMFCASERYRQAVAASVGVDEGAVQMVGSHGLDVFFVEGEASAAWERTTGQAAPCRVAVCFRHALRHNWASLRVFDNGVRNDELAGLLSGLDACLTTSAMRMHLSHANPRAAHAQWVFEGYVAQLQCPVTTT